jgi:hypothetical protein
MEVSTLRLVGILLVVLLDNPAEVVRPRIRRAPRSGMAAARETPEDRMRATPGHTILLTAHTAGIRSHHRNADQEQTQ